jgi:hypothetical protein
LNLGDDRQHVRRAPVSIGPEDRCANLTGGGQVRIAELLAPGLSGAQRGFGSLGDEGPLLLSERGNRCSINGSASAPSSATTNGTRSAGFVVMKKPPIGAVEFPLGAIGSLSS